MKCEFSTLPILPPLRPGEEGTKGWLAVKYEFWKICVCMSTSGRREEENSFGLALKS